MGQRVLGRSLKGSFLCWWASALNMVSGAETSIGWLAVVCVRRGIIPGRKAVIWPLCLITPEKPLGCASFRVTSAWNKLERFRKKKTKTYAWFEDFEKICLVYQRECKEVTTYEFPPWKSNFDNVFFDLQTQKYRNMMAGVCGWQIWSKNWARVFKGRVIDFQNNLHRALVCFLL